MYPTIGQANNERGDSMAELKDLIVDANELDETLLAEMLSPYVSIEKSSGMPIFRAAWHELTIRQKILIHLASIKAAVTCGIIDKEEEPQKPKSIESHTEIKGSSVRPTLRELKDEGLLSQTLNGTYFIPNIRLRNIAAEFSKTN